LFLRLFCGFSAAVREPPVEMASRCPVSEMKNNNGQRRRGARADRRDGDNHGGKLSRTGERQPVRRGCSGSVQTEAIRNALVRFA